MISPTLRALSWRLPITSKFCLNSFLLTRTSTRVGT
ncbi:Uncharacterised protein [Vibrio cholerae]|nr:Uncharacterised protein [Vibrio cholerae]